MLQKNSLPYIPALNNAKPLIVRGAILPLNTLRREAFPLTIIYKVSHAKLNPLALIGSPSNIIQAPKREAPPNVKQDARVGLRTSNLLRNKKDPEEPWTGEVAGIGFPDTPLSKSDPPNKAAGIGDIDNRSKARLIVELLGKAIMNLNGG